ncbi:MAG: amidohydrolase family protein [Proteobacteria bacterium]|nr:amidohydrolase family protein [Pseudomonadota bacterium]
MTEAKPPRLKAPVGTCDTHMHIYEKRFPLAPTAAAVPPVAPVSDYLKVRQRLGIARTVVVQPSAYGTDNTCTLEAIAAMGTSARGIAIVDTGVTDAELDRLTKAGIRGIRFFMLKGATLPWEMLDTLAARVHSFGWHTQLQLNGRDLPEREAQVKSWPNTLVIDHVGRFMDPVPVDHASFKCLLRFLENGRTWVKLSAPYESSKHGPPDYDDVGPLAKALVKAAPERMLWATNWPHPGWTNERLPDDARMLDILLDWAVDAAVRKKILVDNPAKLYAF